MKTTFLLIAIIAIVLSSTFVPYSSASVVVATTLQYDVTASSSGDSKVCGDHICGPGEQWKLKAELNALQHKNSGSNMTTTTPTPTTPTPTTPITLNTTMWINHLGFLQGDPSVHLSFNENNSKVGSNMSGLVIESNTIGNVASDGGDKVITTGLQVPPHYSITNVIVCYADSNNTRSFIDQIRLDQQSPSSTALVLNDTHMTNTRHDCMTSQSTLVNPSKGEVMLDLRLNFGDTSDKIVIREAGLVLIPS
ncbi:MAG TPA: hypothetical protein VEU72_10150 [Nitrosopumilaceae archaeon]|nr:hypothetical protein [Nitrosopumilaceae archaeon]